MRPLHLLGLLSLALVLPTQILAQPTTVTGRFLGDGKEGNLRYLVVQAREPFNDKAAIRLIFTEKDPSTSKKPDFDAGFKRLGSALVLSVFKDGSIFGCEVAHTAHPKSPFTALGTIKVTDFQVTETQVSGRVTTGGVLDSFGQKWEADLTFSAPLPKGAFAAVEPPTPARSAAAPATTAASPSGPKPAAAELPLPASALDIEYKALVQQIAFRSDAPVAAVAAEFSEKLKQQGWQDAPGSLLGKANAILRRKKGEANLTINIQPAGSGSSVKIFAQGLDWAKAK